MFLFSKNLLHFLLNNHCNITNNNTLTTPLPFKIIAKRFISWSEAAIWTQCSFSFLYYILQKVHHLVNWRIAGCLKRVVYFGVSIRDSRVTWIIFHGFKRVRIMVLWRRSQPFFKWSQSRNLSKDRISSFFYKFFLYTFIFYRFSFYNFIFYTFNFYTLFFYTFIFYTVHFLYGSFFIIQNLYFLKI